VLPGLVEAKINFDKDPRLATVVGLFIVPETTTIKPINEPNQTKKEI
tara:strand:+ start:422 stop:562 length:141 start_codon:yes stop_codon:yes gene_type:complete